MRPFPPDKTHPAEYPRRLANAPFAVCWILMYLSQAPSSLLELLRAEIASSATDASSISDQEAMPLMNSIIYETLRLHSSSSSVRIPNFGADGALNVRLDGDDEEVYVDKGEGILLIARAVQMNEEIFGKTVKCWDPLRFYDGPIGSEEHEKGEKRKMTRYVRAFGGGTSLVRRQC